MARSLNVIHLIGNLTREPELRYTSSGRAVCGFGLATNRTWKTEAGELQEESSFHRVVAWEKLAEQCAHLLVQGRKVYVQGRLAYRAYQKDDEEREVAEVVIDDMVLLDAKPTSASPSTHPAKAPESSASGAAPSREAQPVDPTRDAQTPESDVKQRWTDEEIADAITF
jgi:single-strand DNA-binding protein